MSSLQFFKGKPTDSISCGPLPIIQFWNHFQIFRRPLSSSVGASSYVVENSIPMTTTLVNRMNRRSPTSPFVNRFQFHQHFTSSFYACRSRKRKKYSQVVSLFLHFWDLGRYVKAAHKMLAKLTSELTPWSIREGAIQNQLKRER